MSWISALLGLAVGTLAGYFLSRRFGDSVQRAEALQQELDKDRDEHAAYRREVSEHFARTAVAVNQLTESYRSVHQHLSEGARSLCDNASADTALAFDSSRMIDMPIAAAPTSELPAETDEAAETPSGAAPTMEAAHDGPPPTDEPAVEEPQPAPGSGPEESPSTEVPADDEKGAAPEAAADKGTPKGGASWTPATPPEPTEPPRPPRDYAEEERVDGPRPARD